MAKSKRKGRRISTSLESVYMFCLKKDVCQEGYPVRGTWYTYLILKRQAQNDLPMWFALELQREGRCGIATTLNQRQWDSAHV